MEIKNKLFLLFVLIFSISFSQNLTLEIYSNIGQENDIISDINYNKNFDTFEELKNEVDNAIKNLQKTGFLNASINQIQQIKNNEYLAEISLKNKIKYIYVLGLDSISLKGYENYKIIDGKKTVKLPIENIQDFFKKLNQYTSKNGFPFNSAKFVNIKAFELNNLQAEIQINYEKQREIDKIVVKGYKKFPKSYLKHLAKYKIGKKFDMQQVQESSKLLNQLVFIKQTKKPEILFTADSTSIYLYIEKLKKNSFDGFIGFSNDESENNIQLQGYLDFELVNNFNFGEKIEFLYKSEKNTDRILETNIDLPYIFKSPIGVTLGLKLTKKDSSFVSNEQFTNFFYRNSNNHKFSLGLRSINSDEQLETPNNNFQDFKTVFKDFQYEFIEFNLESLLFPVKQSYLFRISQGNRISDDQENKQVYANMDFIKIFDFGFKNSLYINFKSEILESDTYLSNELSRFGGAKSIRGFDENSLFSNKYFLLITEYRYELSNTIYINSIFDIGNYENKLTNVYSNIYGVGIGIGLLTKGGLFSINYAVGSDWKDKIDTKNARIHINFRSFF
tara:strand:+ start:3160 stop:4842 length:1683 start_codon:yes stop_codon:yes gene_type:complete